MASIIQIKGLNKSYGSQQVLKDFSIEYEEGQFIGLMGPNGCGKTTLMKIITGLINDYTGEVLIDGHKPGVHSKNIIAYLPEKAYLANWMRPIDAIKYMADFYKDFDSEKAMKMLETFQLPVKQKIKSMSKGMQEKLQLLLVVCRNAKLYVLDEPIGGVDPAARDFILGAIMKNLPKESTVLISTHLIHDVEGIFDTALMIGNGRVLKNEKVENGKIGNQTIEDVFKEVFSYVW